MFKRLSTVLAMAAIVGTGTCSRTALANKETVIKQPDKVALAESEVTQLMQLMDTDKNGRVSKREWMKFMEIEFDRLDKGKTGTVDVKQLPQPQLRPVRFSKAGK